ncbi:DUF7224 domain-containing protein [Saccharothrix isguenensis]
MSPLLIALRRGTAPVAVPVMVLLGVYAGSRGGSWYVDWGWTSGQLQQHGVLLVPLTAALAAWDASRDRRTTSPSLTRTYPRSPMSWSLLNCAGALLAGLAGWTATFVTMAVNVRGSGGPYWSVVLLGPFCVVAAVLIGAAAGRHLPRYLAAPVIAVTVWLGLAFGSTSTDPLISRLSTVNRECCDVASQPIPATVTGQWLWVTALAVAAVAVLTSPRLLGRLSLAAAATVTAVAAVTLIHSTGGQLTEARAATAEACGTRDGITVCMWPEHAADVDVWIDAVIRYRELFADLRQPAQLYLENGLRPGTDVRAIGARRIGAVRPGMTGPAMVRTIAQDLLFPVPPPCAATGNGSRPYPAATADALLRGWLAQRVTPDASAAQLVPPDQAPRLDRLTSSPVERQRQWYRELVAAHGDCDTPAPTLP